MNGLNRVGAVIKLDTYRNTGWAKTVSLLIFAINCVYCQQIFIIFDTIHYRKLATGKCIVSPPNTVYLVKS